MASSELFEPGVIARLDAAAAGRRLGEPVVHGGLWLAEALVVEPGPTLQALIGDAPLVIGDVARIERAGATWRLISAEGAVICEAEVLCLAGGFASQQLLPELELQGVRGQASLASPAEAVTAAAWGGYLAPTRDGLMFGATHDRGQTGAEVRPDDNRRNLELLARMRPALAASLAGVELGARAGVRAATPDSAPLAGAAADASGLFVLSGLGGRGFTLAPLLAEHVAALALGAPSPLPSPLAWSVRPDRFRARGAKD